MDDLQGAAIDDVNGVALLAALANGDGVLQVEGLRQFADGLQFDGPQRGDETEEVALGHARAFPREKSFRRGRG